MAINHENNEYGDIALVDGTFVRLIQHAYSDNSSDGEAVWVASGYLSTEDPDEQTGPTVKVCWASLGADESDDDADWDRPESVEHYALGELPCAPQ